MQSLLIIKGEVCSQIADSLAHALVVFDVHLLVFHTAPEALHKNGVYSSSSPIPTDAKSCILESVRKVRAGKLHALIGVANLRRGDAQCPIQGIQAKTRIQRHRDFPAQDVATVAIHHGHEIDKPASQADVRDITTPDLIATLDGHTARVAYG